MNQLNQQDLELHVKIVAWLQIIGSVFLLLIGGFLLVFLPTIGAISEDPDAVRVLGFIGPALCFLMGLISAPGFLAGFGLLRRKAWGRVLGAVVSILNLLNFPIGTIIGVYSIWVLFQDEASAYFAPTKDI